MANSYNRCPIQKEKGQALTNEFAAPGNGECTEQLMTDMFRHPNFGQCSQGTFTFDALTGQNSDFGLVYGAIASQYRLANRTAGQNLLRDLGLTPHHVEDGVTIQLVPSDVHGNIPHIGGASSLRNGN